MNVIIDPRWEEFIATAIASGRYASATEVVQAGLRLVEEREAQLEALRTTIDAAIAEGGSLSPEDVAARLDEIAARRSAAE